MTRIPDIVRDFKLETQFPARSDSRVETVHTYHESDLASVRRLVVRAEHWQRQREIGSGSYGRVWLEKCIKGSRAVEVRAVKQLPTHGYIDYHRELEAMTRFSHSKYDRCFTTSFGWFETSTHLFIAMEYLEQGDLLAYLNHGPPLSERDVKVIASQILEGLTMMHGNEFVHGDLKPNNILVKSHPPDMWWVKLSDFGLSKRIEEASGASTLLKGTPGYIAPELYELTDRGTPYAPDIWAVGATLFLMLVKRPAFESLGRLAKYATRIENFPKSSLDAAAVTDLGVEFINSLMLVRPSDRPTADAAIQHEWLKSNSNTLSETRTNVPPQSSQSPTTSVMDLFTEEFASWDTVPSFPAFSSTVNQQIPSQTSSTSKEEVEVSIQREAINDSGGNIRVAKQFHHQNRQGEVAFSANSKILAIAGSKNPIRLWALSSYSGLPGLKGKLRIAFSPDGNLMASCGIFNYLQLWDAIGHTELDSSNLTDYPHSVIFSPDSKMVACVVNDAVFFRNVTKGSKLRKFKYNIAPERCDSLSYLAFSSDSKIIWWACMAKFQKLEIEQTALNPCFKLPPGSESLGLSTNAQYLAYLDAMHKRHTCLLELSTRRVVLEIESYHTPSSVAFSSDNKLFAVSLNRGNYNEGILTLWDIGAKKELSATTYRSRIQSMAFSPNGTMLASTNRDGTTTLWVADTGSQ